MFRTEITFDTSLPQAEIEQLCAMTDAIFAKEDLVCTEKEYGRRVYADKRGAADFATIGVALMAMDTICYRQFPIYEFNGKEAVDEKQNPPSHQ